MVVARNASRAWFGMETATVNPDDLMDELILSVASLSLDVIPEIRPPVCENLIKTVFVLCNCV